MSKRDDDFLHFVQAQLEKEARELDATRIAVRIECGVVIVTHERTVKGQALTRQMAYPAGVDVAALDAANNRGNRWGRCR